MMITYLYLVLVFAFFIHGNKFIDYYYFFHFSATLKRPHAILEHASSNFTMLISEDESSDSGCISRFCGFIVTNCGHRGGGFNLCGIYKVRRGMRKSLESSMLTFLKKSEVMISSLSLIPLDIFHYSYN